MAENSNTKRKKTTKKEKATTATKTKKKATKRTTVAGNWKLKKPMSNEDLKKFLSGVVRGEIKDFAGLDPSLDVRIKAAKELMTINANEEAMEHATTEYRKYKQRTISDVERDYLFSIKEIENSGKKK